MKKVVVTILLVLPFVLIYFVSFTGRVLSSYNHIYVEKIAVVDEKAYEYKSGDTITISKGEEYNLRIRIYPEFATDKTVIFSNSNKNVCTIDSETYIVVGLEYGISRIIITSKDRHFVQYTINIRVADEDIQDIIPNKTEVTITKGKSFRVDVVIKPETTLPENSILVWESQNTSVATVTNGLIIGVDVGDTTVTVRSDHNEDIYKEITVHVVSEYEPGVFFVTDSSNKRYDIYTSEFDLKTITFINLEGVTMDDVWYEMLSAPSEGVIDISNLNNGIIVFKEPGKSVMFSVNALDENGETKTDTITIRYVQS